MVPEAESGKLELRIEHSEVRFYLNGLQLTEGARVDVLDASNSWQSGRFNLPKTPGDRPTLFCAVNLPDRRNTATVRFVRLGPDTSLRWTEMGQE